MVIVVYREREREREREKLNLHEGTYDMKRKDTQQFTIVRQVSGGIWSKS
jgi:hypothetical protein